MSEKRDNIASWLFLMVVFFYINFRLQDVKIKPEIGEILAMLQQLNHLKMVHWAQIMRIRDQLYGMIHYGYKAMDSEPVFYGVGGKL